jgi:hypothetical protein
MNGRGEKTMAWLTPIGLVADILGFLLLAWDILPEYRLYTLRRLNHLLHALDRQGIKAIVQYAQRPDDPLQALAVEMKYLSSFDHLRFRVGLPRWPRESLGSLDETSLARSREEVQNAIEAKERELGERWRPPLRFGITLVILGFLLQFIGSLQAIK